MIVNNKKRKKNKRKKKSGKHKFNSPPRKYNLNFINNRPLSENNKQKNINSRILLGSSSLNDRIINVNKKSKKKNKNISKKQKSNKKIVISYNDFELNSFDYNNALLFDKRTCCQYNISLIKVKNPILFSFCPIKDYNSIIIRSCIFSLSFSIYYVINFSFFDDEILHKMYEIGGKYDLLYFLPKIIISFFVSYYITTIIKIIFLSERNIIKVRSQTS